MQMRFRFQRHSFVALIAWSGFVLEHAVEQPNGEWDVRRSLSR